MVLDALKDDFPKPRSTTPPSCRFKPRKPRKPNGQSTDVAEIRAAQEAIAAQNAKAANDLEQIPADVLQAELTRRAAATTRSMGEE